MSKKGVTFSELVGCGVIIAHQKRARKRRAKFCRNGDTYLMDDKCLIDPQRDCLGLQKANMLEKQMSEWREQSRQTHKEFFDRIRELEKAQAVQREQYDTILEKLAELARSISELSAKPGKRWESIVDKSVWAVLAAVIAFLLARIGL